MRVRKPNVDWNLDLKPARPQVRVTPDVEDAAPANGHVAAPVNGSNGSNGGPFHPPAPPSQELVELINEVRRHVASLDTRIQAIENALARARRQATAKPTKKAAPAPSASPPPGDAEADPAEESVATVKRVRGTPRQTPTDPAAAAS